MILPPFVFIAPNISESWMGCGYILHTAVEPFYLIKIYRYKANAEADAYLLTKSNKALAFKQIIGYNIYLEFYSSLTGMLRVKGKQWEDDIEQLLEAAAVWYRNEKIENNEGFYRKFKIK